MSRLATLVLLPLLAAPLGAADGAPDPDFSADGRATVLWDEVGDSYAEANSVAPLWDGSAVVGGNLFWSDPDTGIGYDWALAKLSRSGVLDTSWGDGGRRRISFDLIEGSLDFLDGIFAEPD